MKFTHHSVSVLTGLLGENMKVYSKVLMGFLAFRLAASGWAQDATMEDVERSFHPTTLKRLKPALCNPVSCHPGERR